MFDEATEALIRQAPLLSGLDRDRVGRILTDAYAKLIGIRVQLRGTQPGVPPPELTAVLDLIQRMAQTYEAFAHVLPAGEMRKGAAFVAATAYKLLVSMANLQRADGSTAFLSQRGVSASVAAAVLFLIAEYTAEAGEIAPAPDRTAKWSTDVALAAALGFLARGELSELKNINLIQSPVEAGREDEAALEHLWEHLIQGVKALGEEILAERNGAGSDDFFTRAFQLSAHHSELDLASGYELGAMPGPHHLAALLRSAGPSLRGMALARTAPPGGVGPKWKTFARAAADRRPFLWPSHLAAIQSGYLERGRSAVVSFPTGAGKSIVAEMRIAATLARGGRVIYLAPTHALVRQICSDLATAFPKENVRDTLLNTGDYAELEDETLPAVAVMTPERCFTLIGVSEQAFVDVETIVFDECHLLHAENAAADRRALDATLCLLRLLAIAPKADVLLMSAMMANTVEIATWLHEATGRVVEPVQVRWKPTRQARGCLVFREDELNKLTELLNAARPKAQAAKAKRVALAKAKGKSIKSEDAAPPADVQRQLVATPQAFFSLTHTWASRDSKDYALVQLGAEKIALTANEFWKVTPNRNLVAADLAVRFARAEAKTVIFVQNPRACESVARRVAEAFGGAADVPVPSAEDEKLLARIEEELGARVHSYVDPTRPVAVHHSLLLVDERRWNEQIFRRKDGIAVLCATNTLAQGMNLPAEAVIIAGDERFDVATNRMERLEAHEVLNAAGRAGRAGAHAQGVVLVIPGQVVQINTTELKIGGRWIELQEDLFSKSDQCLEIRDPLEAILDTVQGGVVPESTLGYLYWRLPVDEDGTVGDAGKRLLATSLAAFRMRGRRDECTNRVDKLVAAARLARSTTPVDGWQGRVMTAAGVSPGTVTSIFQRLTKTGLPATVRDVAAWTIAWMREGLAERCSTFFRDKNVAGLAGSMPVDPKLLPEWYDAFLKRFEAPLTQWIAGETFLAIEKTLLGGKVTAKLERARGFALNVVGDFAYAVGVVGQIARAASEELLVQIPSVSLATAAACVREGFDDPFKLAVRFASGATRVGSHTLANQLDAPDAAERESFPALVRAAHRALRNRAPSVP
jgi:hypothetical protein